jgi:hypothetical protein
MLSSAFMAFNRKASAEKLARLIIFYEIQNKI